MDIQSLTLEEKIGQLCMIGITGKTLQAETENMLANHHVGNIVIRNENTNNPKQLHHLTQNLQSYAKNASLLIAMHQGGGKQNSLHKGVTLSPDQHTLGTINNRLYTRQISQVVGEEMHEMGLNMNLAPSLNLSEKDVNSFGDNIQYTAKHGVEMIRGYHKANIIAAVQSFPGVGELQAHINASLTHIGPFRKSALQPFIQAIEANAQVISVANELTTHSDFTIPAVLSEVIIQKLLREKLGYEGVIMTNNLQDEQITIHHPVEEAAVRAIEAGVDLVLIPESDVEQIAVLNAIKEAVVTGRISEQRIDASVARILQVKETFAVNELIDFDREQFRKQWSVKLETLLEEKAQAASSTVSS